MEKKRVKKQDDSYINESGFDFNKFEIEAIAGLYSGKNLLGTEGVLTSLVQRLVNAAMEGEMSSFLKESKALLPNRRNGKLSKHLNTELGSVEVQTPRDRRGEFEPSLVGKWQRHLGSGVVEQIQMLYAMGNSITDIQHQLQKVYGLDYSSGSISEITDYVLKDILAWQQRPLQEFYAIIFLDGIYFKTRESGRSATKVLYSVYSVDAMGQRDILGTYIRSSEGAHEWSSVLQDLKRRGVKDVLFFCIDGLKGFSDAILEEFPFSTIQRCIVHMIRSSTKLVGSKHIREVCQDLKTIYKASDREQAALALQVFKEKWEKICPEVAKKWEAEWDDLMAYMDFGEPIRRIIYTTNAVEGFHRQLRSITKSKGSWANDQALTKQVYMSLHLGTISWNKKVRNWSEVARGLMNTFGERFTKHLPDI